MLGNKYGTLLKGIPKSEEWKRKASLAKMGDKNPMRNPVYAKKDGGNQERKTESQASRSTGGFITTNN